MIYQNLILMGCGPVDWIGATGTGAFHVGIYDDTPTTGKIILYI